MTAVIRYAPALLFAVAFAQGAALASTVVEDTVIDAASPLSNTRVEIEDGLSGPTTVSIVEGGIAAGVTAREMSTVVVDGGSVTLPSRLLDSSKMVILAGEVSCSDESCLASDPAYLVQLADSSSLEVKGGLISMIDMRDDSTVDFFGTDLMVSGGAGDYRVSGRLVDGTSLYASVTLRGDPTGRINLNVVPEPRSAGLAVISYLAAFAQLRRRRWPATP